MWLIIEFSAIDLGCMGFKKGNSPGSNVTSDHNTAVKVAMTLMWESLKLLFHKEHALTTFTFDLH